MACVLWFYGSTLICTHTPTTTQIIRFNPIERVRDEAHTESALFQHFSFLAYINTFYRARKRLKTDKIFKKKQIRNDLKELRLSTEVKNGLQVHAQVHYLLTTYKN